MWSSSRRWTSAERVSNVWFVPRGCFFRIIWYSVFLNSRTIISKKPLNINMKMYKKIIVSCLAALSFMAFVGSAHAMTLSQSNVSLTVGQSTSVYVYNPVGYVSISSNSNSNVATVGTTQTVSGREPLVQIYGVSAGTTTAIVCDSISGCSTLYITVSGNGGTYGNLSLSQTNISLSVGQTSTVTAYNNYGSYGTLYVSSNSNQYVATTTVTGNTVSIYGSSVGSTNIVICQSYNVCGTVYVTVNGYGNGNGYNNSSGLNLSNVTLSIGSSITVSPSSNYSYYNYNNANGLYVSSNSNPAVASAVNSSSGIIPGCYGTNTYSTTTGQLCNRPIPYNNNTTYIPGCYSGALYSITSGQPCNNNYYSTSSNYQCPAYGCNSIPGCYGTNLYSVITGQPCNGSSAIGGGSGSIVITALSAGSDVITLCQSGSTCSTINVLVNGGYYGTPTNSSYYYGDDPSTTSGIPVIYSTSSAN